MQDHDERLDRMHADDLIRSAIMEDFDAAGNLVTVCSACLRASCFQGMFYCDKYRHAGTEMKTRSELERLGLEDSGYWD